MLAGRQTTTISPAHLISTSPELVHFHLQLAAATRRNWQPSRQQPPHDSILLSAQNVRDRSRRRTLAFIHHRLEARSSSPPDRVRPSRLRRSAAQATEAQHSSTQASIATGFGTHKDHGRHASILIEATTRSRGPCRPCYGALSSSQSDEAHDRITPRPGRFNNLKLQNGFHSRLVPATAASRGPRALPATRRPS